MPAAGIDTPVTVMDTTECPVLDPPGSDVAYRVGCRSEAGTDSDGTVFVIGHSIAGGDAVFDDLGRARPGDTIVLTTRRGVLTYEIAETAVYDRHGQAQLEPRLRGRVPGRLVLVTCYLGPDGTTLTDQNSVVYSTLVGAVPA
ncbi:class F sortase [Gordonia sp. NPDC003376]